jgi:uncharacterized protein (TIGR03000 family)
MFRHLPLTTVPALALAAVLLAAEPSFAQWSSFPGDWAQPGRGPGYGRSGFGRGRVRQTLPFPYGGVSGYYAMPSYTVPANADVYGYQSLYPPMEKTRAYIRVRVPDGARVLFDDSPTTQMGRDRLFVSPPLEDGQSYRYQVSARWTQDGKERTENRSIRVMPGQTATVDFSEP